MVLGFINKKGTLKLFKWIGDLKIPLQSDGHQVEFCLFDSGTIIYNSIGIQFTVNISTLKE